MKRSARHLLRNLAAAIIACAGVTACSQDELAEQGTPLPVGQYPLELQAGGLQAVAAPVQSATRGTFDDDWDGVESVWVIVNDNDDKKKEYKVEASGDKKTARLIPAVPLADSDDLFWWTSTTEEKTVEAWYPCKNTTPPADWSVSPEQTAETLADEDLMYGYAKMTMDDPAIEFEHVLSKVVINLTQSFYLSKASVVSVSLTGQYLTGTFADYGSGVWTMDKKEDGQSQSITACRLLPSNDGYYATYVALCIPQMLEEKNAPSITITVDDVTYRYKLAAGGPISTLYSSGYIYTYNITVKEEGITGVQVEVAPWDETGTEADGSTDDWQEAENIIRLSEYADENLVINKNTVIDGSGTSEDAPFTGTITVNADDVLVVLKDVNIESSSQAITVDGNATLIIQGENSITSAKGSGIYAGNGKVLKIRLQEDAVLTAASANMQCGIGGKTFAGIEISGGKIHAYSSNEYSNDQGCGIGSFGEGKAGYIKITGATVWAYGAADSHSCSAAIGSGVGNYPGAVGDITIINSEIYAYRGWIDENVDGIDHIGASGYYLDDYGGGFFKGHHGTITYTDCIIHKYRHQGDIEHATEEGIDDYSDRTVTVPSI